MSLRHISSAREEATPGPSIERTSSSLARRNAQVYLAFRRAKLPSASHVKREGSAWDLAWEIK